MNFVKRAQEVNMKSRTRDPPSLGRLSMPHARTDYP
jgi:hypothetical protein